MGYVIILHIILYFTCFSPNVAYLVASELCCYMRMSEFLRCELSQFSFYFMKMDSYLRCNHDEDKIRGSLKLKHAKSLHDLSELKKLQKSIERQIEEACLMVEKRDGNHRQHGEHSKATLRRLKTFEENLSDAATRVQREPSVRERHLHDLSVSSGEESVLFRPKHVRWKSEREIPEYHDRDVFSGFDYEDSNHSMRSTRRYDLNYNRPYQQDTSDTSDSSWGFGSSLYQGNKQF